MENQNLKKKTTRNANSKILAGMLIVLFGVLFLMNRIGVNVPRWIFSWEIILISIGIVSLYKHKFKHFAGYVMITIGTVFLVNDFNPHFFNTSLLLPIFVIAFGTMMIGKATNLFGRKKKVSFLDDAVVDFEEGDYVEGSTVFGSVKKNVVSKNFQGASFTTIFGGTELNLTKADIQGPVIIDSTVVFGGLKIFIPATWNVVIESNAMFGGVEDKRQLMNDENIDPNKTITLTGNCLFGGVEIKNFF